MLTVGQFARMARLSAKQLRSYDALGLLAPARVDADSGYRYYHPRQVRTAVTIALLRSLDVPLEAIRALLVAEDDEAERLLADQRARLAAELAARERALRALAKLRTEHELMPYEVTTAFEPPRRLLALHGTSAAERLDADAAATSARLLDALPWARAADVPVLGVYPVDLDGAVAFAVGVEASGRAATTAPGAAGPAGAAAASDASAPGAAAGRDAGPVPLDLPGGPVARVLHVGPHDELPLAYFPLLAWLQERGHPAAGPVRERYVDDPAAVPPEQLRTEVSIPLLDPGGPPP